MVTPAGLIPNPVVIVTVASAVLPKLSVTLTTSVPAPAGAVYTPVVETIDPVPLNIENEYGATPAPAVKKMLPVTDVVVGALGEIVRTGLIVILALAVAPKASVTRSTAAPLAGGAV